MTEKSYVFVLIFAWKWSQCLIIHVLLPPVMPVPCYSVMCYSNLTAFSVTSNLTCLYFQSSNQIKVTYSSHCALLLLLSFSLLKIYIFAFFSRFGELRRVCDNSSFQHENNSRVTPRSNTNTNSNGDVHFQAGNTVIILCTSTECHLKMTFCAGHKVLSCITKLLFKGVISNQITFSR